MSRLNDVLVSMVGALAGVGGAKTVRLGLEANVTPDDYPIVRLVPTRAAPLANHPHRKVEVLVYFGDRLLDFDGLAAVYARLLDLEEQIVAVVGSGAGWKAVHVDTVFDEDRLPAYKIAAARFDVTVM